MNGMELPEGKGNVYDRRQPVEGDEIILVWMVDSDELPSYRWAGMLFCYICCYISYFEVASAEGVQKGCV
jgi:hypothetical protein